ncbi:cupin [Kitasatospora sp. NA04385]|uniref:JmjC domain-containing protein n=1 Tax=Kitasatospora sp. NA04385 TaxID=2742135 RepID=UPI001591DB5A|nr:cupin domain-containing protein [Kitasatospora sp. NA04385]QKW21299.1 cupin [Kitasatospora sp. NA04385]
MTETWLRRFVPDEERFRTELWRTAPAVLHPAHPPVDVLPAAELDRLLDHGLLRAPYLGLVQRDAHLPDARFCPPRTVLGEPVGGYADGAAVRALIRDERATLLLRYVDQWHHGVRTLCHGLAAELGRPVEAFYFLTPPGTQGRPVHRDDADVFVVQLSGAKRWWVHGGPADGNWVPEREDGDPGEALLDTVLRPGEVLYVPRGFAHRARAEEGAPSAHLSLTVREVASANLYAVAQGLLADSCELPGRPLDDAALTGAAARLLDHAAELLAELTPADLLAVTRQVVLRPAA